MGSIRKFGILIFSGLALSLVSTAGFSGQTDENGKSIPGQDLKIAYDFTNPEGRQNHMSQDCDRVTSFFERQKRYDATRDVLVGSWSEKLQADVEGHSRDLCKPIYGKAKMTLENNLMVPEYPNLRVRGKFSIRVPKNGTVIEQEFVDSTACNEVKDSVQRVINTLKPGNFLYRVQGCESGSISVVGGVSPTSGKLLGQVNTGTLRVVIAPNPEQLRVLSEARLLANGSFSASFAQRPGAAASRPVVAAPIAPAPVAAGPIVGQENPDQATADGHIF